jgi:type IV pilus assembly protein PilC
MQLSNREKFLLYAELTKLVAAGFGIGKSAELLAGQAGGRAVRRYAEDLQSGLAEGLTVADAVARGGSNASGLEVAILRATETGGVLAEGLLYLRDHFEAQWKLWRTIRSRLAYPAALLHFAAFVPVIPPLVTGKALGSSAGLAVGTLALVYVLAVGFWLGSKILGDRAQTQVGVDQLLRRIPLLGGARRLIGLQRFSGIFRVYLVCGSTASVGLDGAGEATQSAVMRRSANRLARHAEAGEALGGHLEVDPVFPGDFARSLSNAERIGGLEEDLKRWADWYGQAVAARLDLIGVWIPKAIYFGVAIYVGWQVIRTYLGVYEPMLKDLEQLM